MRTRTIVDTIDNNKHYHNVVFFNSAGIDDSSYCFNFYINTKEPAKVASDTDLIGAGDDTIGVSGEYEETQVFLTNNNYLKLTLNKDNQLIYKENDFDLTIDLVKGSLSLVYDNDFNFTGKIASDDKIKIFDITSIPSGFQFFNTYLTDTIENKLYLYPCSKKVNATYVDGKEGVSQSIYQRLTLIQGELKHYMNAGRPLLNGKANKQMLDSYILNVARNMDDIISIKRFESEVINYTYKAKLVLNTNYGDIMLDEEQDL